MNRDDIIRMARESGFRAGHIELHNSDPLPFVAPCSATDCMPELVRFAALVAAAERDALRAAVQHEAACVEAAKAEIAALRAKIEAMERQEPSHWGCTVLQSDGRWKEEVSREAPPEGWFSLRDIFPLYALPGAKGDEK